MKKSPNQADNSTQIYALGGLDEVGKNMYVVEHRNEIIIMDCGQKFASYLPGVNAIIPDFSYLKLKKASQITLIVTHGHEDHIGAIPYFLREFKIKTIYAPRLGINLLKHKFQEYNIGFNNLIEYDNSTIIKTKYFTISLFIVNHSIPESYGVAFEGPNGVIVNTGDYKFDFTPIGPSSDFNKIAKLGDKEIDVLLADSTNSEISGYTHSESIVKEEIEKIFQKAKGRIILATFASNVHRVSHIVETAKKYNRRIIVFGRSMVKVTNIGIKLKLINDSANLFMKANEISRIDDENILILSTGSQGEQLAALSRMASGRHVHVKVKPTDTIVFSSSPIPGNTLNITTLINKLARFGAGIKINKENGILHTSGHATVEEQKLMFALTKPKNFMPVHGEYRMLIEHGKTAVEMGVKKENIFICDNGDTLLLNNKKVSIGRKKPAGVFYIDQNSKKISQRMFTKRILMNDNGVVGILIPFNNKLKKLITTPKVITKGFVLVKENLEIIQQIQKKTIYLLKKELANARNWNERAMKKTIAMEVSKLINRKLKRNSYVAPIFIQK